jgi:hypothetical protein
MIGCIFDTALIEVEAVDVYVCFHYLNTEAAERRLRTRFAGATTGGYASIIAKFVSIVKSTIFQVVQAIVCRLKEL